MTMAAKNSDGGETKPRSSVLVFLTLSLPFLTGLYLDTPLGIFYYGHAIALSLYACFVARYRRLGLHPRFVFFFAAVGVVSIVNTFLTSNQLVQNSAGAAILVSAAKLLLLIFFAALFYLAYIATGASTRRLFSIYLSVAHIFAIFAISQELLFIVSGIDVHGYIGNTSKNYGSYIGVSALSSEPAFFACALLPAGGYYMAQLARSLKATRKALIVLTAMLCTTSALGYLGLFLAALMAYLIRRTAKQLLISLASLPLLIALFLSVFSADFFQVRWRDSVAVVMGGELSMRDGMNLSTYAAVVNLNIVLSSLSDSGGLGAGFGLYPLVFDEYIYGYEQPGYRDSIPGRGSGTSLFTRLTGELGVFGWILIFLFFWWGFKALRRGYQVEMCIAYLATAAIIVLRMGEYYVNGVVLVFLMLHLLLVESGRRRADAPSFNGQVGAFRSQGTWLRAPAYK